jgi:hypothetical protein
MGVMVGATVGVSIRNSAAVVIVEVAAGIPIVGGGGGAPHKEGWHATSERILIRINPTLLNLRARCFLFNAICAM